MKKSLLFFGIGLLSYNFSLAQDAASADQKMLPSNSGGGLNNSLGNMLSPNLFDGSATIGIPIYDYGNFGISLTYNTKGVTLDELSGPVGTHWNLATGSGSITRAMKDIPDEISLSYTGNNNISYTAVGKQVQYALSSPTNTQYWDGQNDEFMVSAGSLNFTFKIGKNGYFLTYPQSRCKITPVSYTFSDGSMVYDNFIIGDEQGNKYYFGKGEQTNGNYNTGNPNTAGGAYAYVSRWDLDSVVLADGKKIVYDYEPFAYPGNIDLYMTKAEKDLSDGSQPYLQDVFVSQSQVSSYGNRLTTIHYPDNTTATFVFDQITSDPYEECQKSIKQIEIRQGDNCKKYKFNKVYLTQDTNNLNLAKEIPFGNECNYNDYSNRLVLKSIDVLSCDEQTTEPYYSFEYSTTAAPNRYGNNRDFFGYCNGIATNIYNQLQNQVPSHIQAFSTSTGQPASNKANSTDANIVSTLNLTKVKNAYGGSLTFQYELHSGLTNEIPNLPNPNTDHLFLGLNATDGVRLHATVTSDKYHPGADLTTTYSYSGGQFFLNGGYYSFPSGTDANGIINAYTVTNAWISTHQLINGSNHGYSQVTITNTDANGNVLSSTKHYFSNFYDNGVLRQLINGSSIKKNYYDLPYSDKQYIKDWEIGLPTKTEEFDEYGNIVTRTSNFYSSRIDSTSALLGLGKNWHTLRVVPPATPVNVLTLRLIATDTFVPYSGISLLDSTVSQKFVNSTTSINDTVRYKYDDRNNLSYTITRNSKGEYFRLQNIYNYNVVGSTILSNMTNNGLELRIGMERWKQNTRTPSISDLLMDANITRYQYQNNKIWTQKLHTLRSLQPISYNVYTSSGTTPYFNIITSYDNPSQALPNFQLTSEVLQFDAKGNPIETQLKGQDLYKSMIWDTLTGKETAEIINARLQDVGYTSFEVNFNGGYTGQETITDGGFAFKQGGIQYQTGDNMSGRNTYKLTTVNVNTAGISTPSLRSGQPYIITFWAKGGHPVLSGYGFNYVPLTSTISVNGWTFFQAKFTPISNGSFSFSCDTYATYFDELRLFPTNASMQSTFYTPMFGKTSETDERGNITYFQYDALGRQIVVEDQNKNVTAKKIIHIGQ